MSTKLSILVCKPTFEDSSSIVIVIIFLFIFLSHISFTSESGPQGNVDKRIIPSTLFLYSSILFNNSWLYVQYSFFDIFLYKSSFKSIFVIFAYIISIYNS